MNVPRKVYIASYLSEDDLDNTFKQWPEGFVRTPDRNEAEFVVFDAANMPDDWPAFGWGKKPDHYVPTDNLPVFFIALGGKPAPQFDYIKKTLKLQNLPVYDTPAELFDVLEWLRCIFPFYNKKKEPADTEKVNKVIQDLVLSISKANSGR